MPCQMKLIFVNFFLVIDNIASHIWDSWWSGIEWQPAKQLTGMTFGSATESNPEDKVNNSPNFLRVNQAGGGELTARSGTEFTWSPQLRNLAEWDWVAFSFKTNMVEKADMEGRWVFAQFLVFLHPNIKKRFSRTFLMEFLDIRRSDVWTVHGWLHLPWFGISASSVI